MAKQVTFIHAADFHLDSPFKGLATLPDSLFQNVKDSTFHALNQLVQAAIDKKVDFVLITGDLFDNEKQSLKAQIRLKNAFELLNRHRINVYLSYGNHDFIRGNKYPITYPDNVYVFPDEKVRFFTFQRDGIDLVHIYGFSYENRAVLERKIDEYEMMNTEIPFHIGMLHGSITSNTEHDVYAPFHIKDLLEKNFNYWALGHIHQREVLKTDPPIVYPGNIQGRNRKEEGEKGCYYVELNETSSKLTFVPLQFILFSSIQLDVSKCVEVQQLESIITDELMKHTISSHQLVDLTLISNNPILKQWETAYHLEEIVSIINENIQEYAPWKYIYRYQTIVHRNVEKDLHEGEHFVGELIRHIDDVSIRDYVDELYNHRETRKYLEGISDDEEKQIKDEALTLLLNELVRE